MSNTNNTNGIQFSNHAARLRALASKPLTNRQVATLNQNQPVKININQNNTFEKAIRSICSPGFLPNQPKFIADESKHENKNETTPEPNKFQADIQSENKTPSPPSSQSSNLSSFRELVVNKEKNIKNNKLESKDESNVNRNGKSKEIIDEINKNVIDKFYERTSDLIENKFNELNNYINEFTFNSATNSLPSNSKLKQERSSYGHFYRINNNHLNKLNRLNDLIDLSSLKYKKQKRNKNKKRNDNKINTETARESIEQAMTSEDAQIKPDNFKSDSYMEMQPV
jgi:hypothetical protein